MNPSRHDPDGSFPWPRLGLTGGESSRGVKVMICDDERAIVRLLQIQLEQQGYEVIVAFDGQTGLAKIREEHPDLCVLDVMMPYMDGIEVLQRLRRDPNTEHLPVIMLTAKSQDVDVFQAYRNGADMYLTKPFNPLEVIHFIDRIYPRIETRPGLG
jgi:two-component system alkaline phosphatase synthesis response regulator PhoP/two-component system response regulator VicR